MNRELVMSGKRGGLSNAEILGALEGVDQKRGAEVAGHRAYYLKGYMVMLNQALIQYGLSFLRRRGYLEIQPPLFMKRSVMARTAELKDFAETLYVIPNETGGEGEQTVSKEDLFLIATSEQPICALHMNEVVNTQKAIK